MVVRGETRQAPERGDHIMFDNVSNIPIPYTWENVYNGARHPSAMHSERSGLARYFQRYLTQKIISNIEIEGVPEHWPGDYYDYMLYSIIIWGYVSIINTDKYGMIPQWCTLKGRGVCWEPTNIVVSNPLLRGIIEPEIGTECALIKMQPDYGGAWDIITFYADMLALSAETAATNLLNSKLAYVFFAKDKQSAETFKKLYDKIGSGEPAAVIDKKLFDDENNPLWQSFNQDLRQTYIAGDILEDMTKWDARFCTDIGIPNVNVAKESGVGASEVAANNADTESKITLWCNTMQAGFDRCNKLFGTSFAVKPRWGGDQNVSAANIVPDGNI